MLAENYPPSKVDIEMTREVGQAANAVGIAPHDHIVISRTGHASCKELGLL